MNNRTYVCIDLKSFYASVECIDRGLDPFITNLVVADPERSEKTICLAVSPAMKSLGVPGRCRVFEIPKNISYIMAQPRMQRYIDVSASIYGIYLSYISADDIHVYSIDEVFMDVTDYLNMYKMSAKELAVTIMKDVLEKTGITATAGIGTNLYLAKVGMDIWAKHVDDHIGVLDEELYQKLLWDHLPLTDFWRIGPGTVKRLAKSGISTMREIAHADEDLLYHLFGIDAELLIDHAWGQETATMADIKAYRPHSNCISQGQILPRDYNHAEGRIVVREMADLLCLDLVKRNAVTEGIVMYIGYAKDSGLPGDRGSCRLSFSTSSASVICDAAVQLYEDITDPTANIRRIGITLPNIEENSFTQMSLFVDNNELDKENRMQQAMLSIKQKFGDNAILKGMNLQKGATTMERNNQIGGHKSGAKTTVKKTENES